MLYSKLIVSLITLQLLCLAVTLCTAKPLSTSSDFSSARAQRNVSPLHLSGLKRAVRDPVRVRFNLSANTTEQCNAGLTHDGVFVQMEYRLLDLEQESPGRWIAVKNFELEPSGITNYIQILGL